jgi:hypothetical protein
VNSGTSFDGNVQWDGKYLAVGDQDAQIYRYAVHGTNLTLKDTVPLTGAVCIQTWIGNGDILCPDALTDAVYVFKYPAGGSPVATLTGTFDYPTGSVQATK